MLEVKITLIASELAAAINNLAAAIGGQSTATAPNVPTRTGEAPAAPVEPTQSAAAPTQVQAPTQPDAPVQPPVAPPAPPVVPVAAPPTYNRDQIMTAGAALIDAGKINELMGLLNAFGVQAVTQLKQEQLGAFATELRKLGAQI